MKVFCEIHSQMKGYIVVVESDAFAQPDEEGGFKIEDVPPGSYTLVAWHPSFDPKTIKVEIGSGETQVQVDF